MHNQQQAHRKDDCAANEHLTQSLLKPGFVGKERAFGELLGKARCKPIGLGQAGPRGRAGEHVAAIPAETLLGRHSRAAFRTLLRLLLCIRHTALTREDGPSHRPS